MTVAVDGSEDELIHCLKPSQPCPSGLAQLKAVQQQPQQKLENDQFKDITLSDVKYAAPIITLLEDSDTYTEVECLGETPYFSMIDNVCLIEDA